MNNTIQYFTELFNNNPLLNAFSLFLAISKCSNILELSISSPLSSENNI